ncbi:MAG: hypothetical protein M3Q10_14815 [Chloroflexota bacterium]|nr:hypothetical protein [Chloroflexota bacterium]
MTARINHEAVGDFGLAGALFTPADGVVSAGVVVLGGSEGGMHEHDARVLAGKGFAALALAYFGAAGVPPVLKDVPLEYFSRAIDLLQHRGVRAGAVGLLGGSRGGEAALLAASRDERVGAVVSVVGSGVVTQGIDFRLGRLDRILREPTNAWTSSGRPLPYLPHLVSDDLADRIARGGTVALRDAYPAPPVDPVKLDEVSIPVERIRGAVLLLSSRDDRMWNSAGLSQVAAERLRTHRHPYPWEHIVFEGAGHSIAGPPGQPQTSTTTPGPGVTFDLGGSPQRTTEARREAWERSVAFSWDHLGAGS